MKKVKKYTSIVNMNFGVHKPLLRGIVIEDPSKDRIRIKNCNKASAKLIENIDI